MGHSISAGLVLVLAFGGTAGAAASPGNKALLAQAKKSLLTLRDMPKGWTSSKSDDSDSTFPGAAALASCLGVPVSVVDYNAPAVNSPQFTSKNQLLSVSESVSVYSSAKAARTDFASGAKANAPSCLATDLNGAGRTEFDKQFGAKAQVGTITVTRLPAADFAPHSANFTMFFPVTTQGTTLNVEITEVDIVRGKEEQTTSLTAVQSTFPTSLERQLTMLEASRF